MMMRKVTVFVLIVFVASLFHFTTGDEAQILDKPCGGGSPYLIVIDGGSTGSRLHIFHLSENDESECICSRKGSSRVNVPLSAFAPEDDQVVVPEVVVEHLLPLFEFAAQVIPPSFHNSTIARYEATAGMRLLSEEQQAAVYDAMYEGLMAWESFSFRGMKRTDIETLSGDLEGFYGVVAANFLAGIVDTNLHVIEQDTQDKGGPRPRDASTTHPIGALDMGGSSTQIVYLTEQVDNGDHSCPNDRAREKEESSNDQAPDEEEHPQTCSLRDPQAKRMLQGEDFFSTSYLAYGVDQFRERLWEMLIYNRKVEDYSQSCDTKVIEYPCGFKGHEIRYGLDYADQYTLIGTGDAEECQRQIQRLLPHPETTTDHHQHCGRMVGGIEHPPVTGKFFAMSLYFFTLDSLRVLSQPKADAHEALNLAWPRPSIEELANALDGLCSRSWEGDLADIRDHAHEFTRAEVLPHRCFESAYMVTLLRDGFGFHPESRNIEFTFLVDGNEVEWSLGMALSLNKALKTEDKPKECGEGCQEKEADNNSTIGEHRGVDVQETLVSFASMVTSSG